MSKRFLAALLIALLPTGVLADDTPAPDAGLGPSTTNSQGSSSADSSTLQPAAQDPLQSTTNDATGLTAPNSSALQGPVAGNGDLQVIAGDADGSTHTLSSGPNYWGWAGFTLLFAIIVTCGCIVWRDRRRFAEH